MSSLFGSAAPSQPAAGGLFGAPAASTQPSQATSLFGSAAAPAQSAPSGSLFGASMAPSQSAPGANLFGKPAATAQPAASGSLFGNSNAAAQPATSGGLFGNSTAGQSAQTGGLFGSSTATNRPAQTGGLFGGSTTASTTAQTGGLFGGSMAANQQANGPNKPTGTAFGAQQSTNTNGMFGNRIGGLTMGQSTNNTQQTVPGVRIDMSNIRSTTRFNDLHDDLQKQMEAMDKTIHMIQAQANDITAMLPGHGDQLSHLPNDVDFLTRKSLGVQAALEADAEALDLVGRLSENDLADATVSFRAADILNLPQQYQYHPRGFFAHSTPDATSTPADADIVSFFTRATDDLDSSLRTYKQRVSEIETHLKSVEHATMQQAAALSNGGQSAGEPESVLREVALVLRDYETGILAVAGKVGACREGVQKLQLGGFEELGGGVNGRGQRQNGNGKRSGIY